MRTGVTVRAAVVAVAAAVGCGVFDASPRALLEECVFNDDCASPLLCAARRCRAQCRSDRDCTNGWRCRSAGQLDKYVCYEPGTEENACVFASDCSQSFVCANRVCARQCRSSYDCRLVDNAATCLVDLGVCSTHPHLTDGGTLLDVARNDKKPDGAVDP